MASYYYLMAQLPSIQPDSAPVISFKAFKDLALRSLTLKDARILNSLSPEPPRCGGKTGSAFLDMWYSFERALRLALEQGRSAKLKWDAPISYEERELLASAFAPVQAAQTALQMQNPLEAELFLNKVRFNAANITAGADSFSSNGVFSYALKLLLNEKALKFNTETGKKEYSHIYNKILEPESAV